MAIVRCPQGHFYDDNKFESCPLCSGVSGGEPEDEERTVSLDFVQDREQTVQLTPEEPVQSAVYGTWDSEKTVALSPSGERELLCGWLVCTAGPSRGQDYRLYPGFNRVGRDWDADICVQDMTVSRENHCAVVYDAKGGRFYLTPGQGTLTYLDGKQVERAMELPEQTPICLGNSTLELVAFCKGDHTWEAW